MQRLRRLLYIPCMRHFIGFGYVSAVLLLLAGVTGCGGRAVTRKSAEKLLVNLPSGILDSQDIEVRSVSQISSSTALVETTVRAAFRVQKVKGEWVVREVRVGNGQWETIDNLLAALNLVKVDQTRQLLETIASSVGRYKEKNGRLPAFEDYAGLSDALYPDYLTEPNRLDAWRQPLRAFREGSDKIRYISAGPDEKPDSPDDIILVKTYPP